MTKSILCFGDSNTWGYAPGTGSRYPRSQRWPGVMQAALGADYHVIEEGLNSRTTIYDDPTRGPGRNGLEYLWPCLDTHAPLDLVILLLGTNDLKHRFGLSAFDISQNAAALVGAITGSGATKATLLIAPAHLGPQEILKEQFAGSAAKSRALSGPFRAAAEQLGCAFFDAAEVVSPSPVDGVHWEAEGHARLGSRLAEVVRRLLA